MNLMDQVVSALGSVGGTLSELVLLQLSVINHDLSSAFSADNIGKHDVLMEVTRSNLEDGGLDEFF